jgi:hypothetical protein
VTAAARIQVQPKGFKEYQLGCDENVDRELAVAEGAQLTESGDCKFPSYASLLGAARSAVAAVQSGALEGDTYTRQ